MQTQNEPINSLARQLMEHHCMMKEYEAVKIILQAIKSGDFMQHVNISSINSIPTFTYKPYEYRELQEHEIKRLSEIINRNSLCIKCGEKINYCVCNNE